MKKKLFLLCLLVYLNVTNTKAQTIIYSNDFTSDADLVVYDIDEDGRNWNFFTGNAASELFGLSGNFMGSQSWDAIAGGLAPDNLLVTPDITIPANTLTTTLRFKLAAVDQTFPAENISVYVAPSTTTTLEELNLLTPVFSYTLTNIDAQSPNTYTVDVSSYNGQTIKLGFRHHECFDQNILLLDDVELIQQTLSNQPFSKSNFVVFPNPANDSITLENNGTSSVSALIFTDVNGRIVKKITDENKLNQTVSVADLTKGIYFLALKTSEGTFVEKLIKN